MEDGKNETMGVIGQEKHEREGRENAWKSRGRAWDHEVATSEVPSDTGGYLGPKLGRKMTKDAKIGAVLTRSAAASFWHMSSRCCRGVVPVLDAQKNHGRSRYDFG